MVSKRQEIGATAPAFPAESEVPLWLNVTIKTKDNHLNSEYKLVNPAVKNSDLKKNESSLPYSGVKLG